MALAPSTDEKALQSVHTPGFPAILRQLGISLLVTTYQAGKLVALRADGPVLNTHFRQFSRPMGLAVQAGCLALGTQCQIEEFRNMPAVAARLDPPDRHDAVFLPRRQHITGDIDVHEMGYADDGALWFVNTRFSCLCTLDGAHSFVPRWRPPFISAYAPTDRCHLNGLAMRQGMPRYVTALGISDTDYGWRARKADGGLLMDIHDNTTLLDGLSMPHSPRWHQNRLWLLESGRGGLNWFEPERGLRTLVNLPGFTRGLDFAGDFAFVGVSKVRETATFSGLPLTRSLSERYCGVWVVDLRNGRTAEFVRFESAVQEIFSVVVLPNIRYPDIVNHDALLIRQTYSLPDEALRDVCLPQMNDTVELLHGQGLDFYLKGEKQKAAEVFRQATESWPDYLPARYDLAVVLNDLECFDEAIPLLQQVIADEAAHADAHVGLSFAHSQQRQPEDAIRHLRAAIAIRPDFAQAHLNLAMLLLMTGRYVEGWREFEWRWQCPGFTPFAPPSHPRWDGTPMPKSTLLIHTEQGAGDAIQFFRFLPRVAGICRKLLLIAPVALHPLLIELTPNIVVQAPGDLKPEEFDAYLPLMSLASILELNDESEFSAPTPYLAADLSRLKLNPRNKSARIGLVWAGSSTFANDRHRSIALAELTPLLDAFPEFDWFSLQKGDTEQMQELLRNPGQLVDLGPRLNDYGDTASALCQMDLLISVDTSVAHLAGALGLETWLLLPYNADWRWQSARENSPWYPSMRLFRQARLGEWTPVIRQVLEALETMKRDPEPFQV